MPIGEEQADVMFLGAVERTVSAISFIARKLGRDLEGMVCGAKASSKAFKAGVSTQFLFEINSVIVATA